MDKSPISLIKAMSFQKFYFVKKHFRAPPQLFLRSKVFTKVWIETAFCHVIEFLDIYILISSNYICSDAAPNYNFEEKFMIENL